MSKSTIEQVRGLKVSMPETCPKPLKHWDAPKQARFRRGWGMLYDLAVRGRTLKDIGVDYDLGKERVRQITGWTAYRWLEINGVKPTGARHDGRTGAATRRLQVQTRPLRRVGSSPARL
jgi:hypothetical protein